MYSVIFIALCCFAGLLLLKHLQVAVFSPLSAIPNAHFLAPYTRYWLKYLKAKGQEHRVRDTAHKRLGPVIRLGPKELSVNCIENGVSTIYGGGSGGWDRGAWYEIFENYGHSFMFAMAKAKPHSERKRMIANVYTKTYIQSSHELTDILHTMLSERLIPQMHSWAENGDAINVQRENKAYNMDCSTAYFFGLGNGTNFIEMPDEKALLKDFELGMSGLFWFAEAPGITSLMRRFGIKLLRSEVFQSCHVMEEICLKMCGKAKLTVQHDPAKGSTSHPTVYAQLRKKLEEANVASETLDTLIAAELLDHTQAGHEPSGITLTYLMAELSRNPSATEKLREELRTLRRVDAVWSSPQALDNLPYLDAVLMETMRLYPGALGPFPRLVPAGGAKLGKFSNIPAGTTVSTSAYALHRNPSVFRDPEKWQPERWLHSDTVTRKEMQKWFWEFGSGSRMCIGNYLAIRIMKSFIAAVYSEFDMSLVNGKIPKQTDSVMAYPEGNKCLMRFHKIKPVLA